MSQVGTILGVSPLYPAAAGLMPGSWQVTYKYALDAGGFGQAMVVLADSSGWGGSTIGTGPGAAPIVTPGWTSGSSFITVSPNPPGTTNPVQIQCPDIVRAERFNNLS